MSVINNFRILVITLLLEYHVHGVDVIMVLPTNQTKLERETVQFNCKAEAIPGNVTVQWFQKGVSVEEVTSLYSRITIQQNGSLIIKSVSADDSGHYRCETNNATGVPQSASAYLNVLYPAKVIATPTIQYLHNGLEGVVQCNLKANPPLQYVTWIKDLHLLDQSNDIVFLSNGSLLFPKVNQNHQGLYTCTPYNSRGTQGSSGPIEVLVRKPPNFTIKPEPVYQREVGEAVEMHCNAQEADGTLKPSIVWQRRDGTPLQEDRVRISGGNITIEGLRISDFGIYQCVASNGVTIATETQLIVKGTPYILIENVSESSVTLSWLSGYSGDPDSKEYYTIRYRRSGVTKWLTIRVHPLKNPQVTILCLHPGTIYEFQVVGKNALVGQDMVSYVMTVQTLGVEATMVLPTNETKLEGETVQFNCKAEAIPGNVTVKWFQEEVPVEEVTALDSRITIQQNGSLIIKSVSADDSGQYLCETTNGTAEQQSATVYLNVVYPAKVIATPTIQYLHDGLEGIVQCNIKANPPLQYVTWTKDNRPLESYQFKNIVFLSNDSLRFTKVNQNHQGRYTCTPFNSRGTQGTSGPIEVSVRKPLDFAIKPELVYQRQVGEAVEMHCNAQEADGTQKPAIIWQRRDGTPLQEDRVRISGGNITIEELRISDFGIYQCVASNGVTIATETQLIAKGTPYILITNASESSVTLSWLPGDSGEPDSKQDYTILYREAGVSEWLTIPVNPSESTQVTINRLGPGTTYEFQVVGKKALGQDMVSYVMTVQTLDLKPSAPRNFAVENTSNGSLITWEPPLERSNMVQYYKIEYRTDGPYRNLNTRQIGKNETSYLVKNLLAHRTYYFRLLAFTVKNFESSDELKYVAPVRAVPSFYSKRDFSIDK